jgi:hypothetical protein
VQIDCSSPEGTVPEEKLDGPKIDSRLQEVGGEAMTERVGVDSLAEASLCRCALDDGAYGFRADGIARFCAGEQEWPGALEFPVFSELR